MRKRGISTIVATVLIVLISVAAVTVLWFGVFPLLGENIFVEDVAVRFIIDKSESYTVYDPDNNLLSIQVKRSNDKADVVGLKFVIDSKGNTRAFRTSDVVGPNSAKVYIAAVGFLDTIDSVKLVPIYLVNGEEREGNFYFLEEKVPRRGGALADKKGNDFVEVSEGLVFYYSFDEEPYGVGEIFDYSGYNHTGTVFDDVYYVEEGKVGGAYVFDGDGDYIKLFTEGAGDSLDSEDKTISFWAKPECKSLGDPPIKDSIIFGSYINYYINFLDICGAGNSFEFDYSDSSGGVFFDLGGITKEIWNYYTLTIDVEGTSVSSKLYVNGVEVSSYSSSNGYGTINTNFYLGSNAHPSGAPVLENSFNGTIDEFRIYNRILTSEEIMQLYNLEK